MGNKVSAERLRPQRVTWGSAIRLRIQQWGGLKPILLSIIDSMGLEWRDKVTSSQTPQPRWNVPREEVEDAVVGNINMAIEVALPNVPIEVTIPDRDRESEGGTAHVVHRQGRTSNELLVQRIKLQTKKLTSDQAMPDTSEPDADAPPEVRDAYVFQQIRSSLDIALPNLDRRKPGQSGVFPRLSSYTSLIDDNRPIVADDPNYHPGQDTTYLPPATPSSTQKPPKTESSNYETWDANVYSSLKLDANSIRLVEILPSSSGEIQVELVKKPFDEVRDNYEALSYVWGPNSPAQSIKVNNIGVFSVNPNLFDALIALRLPDVRRSIWIDAICINQKDMLERSMEVRKMGQIYRLAKRVVIFLGFPTPAPSAPSATSATAPNSIANLFTFLNRTGDNTLPEADRDKDDTTEAIFQRCGVEQSSVCKGFVELCLQPWWTRVWTRQEFYLASQEPVWYWGKEHMSNSSLKRDIEILISSSVDLWLGDGSAFPDIQKMIGKPPPSFMTDMRRIADMISRRLVTNGSDTPSRLYRELSAECSDPRDLVYGLREIFDTSFLKVFVPDYFKAPELIFACLAVFLIQLESWGDMLWWYPSRRDQEEDLPSWLPDYTRRVQPTGSEFQPHDEISAKNHPKLIVVQHILHAEGQWLDAVDKTFLISNGDGYSVLRTLWHFDQRINRNQKYSRYSRTDGDQEDSWFNLLVQMCREASYDKNDHGILNSGTPLLQWTSTGTHEDMPTDIALATPVWDILTGSEYQLQDVSSRPNDEAEQWRLENIFSPQINGVFQSLMAEDFIGSCIFDMANLSLVLEALLNTSPWSKLDSGLWQQYPKDWPAYSKMHHARKLANDVRLFLAAPDLKSATETVEFEGLLHYSPLCCALLLDSVGHSDFRQKVSALITAAVELADIATDNDIYLQVCEEGQDDKSFRDRLRKYLAIQSKYEGRCLFVTKKGFHGLSSPGVKGIMPGDNIALLDGLSFPMVFRDVKSDEADQKYPRLVGCALIRDVDIRQGVDSESTKLPEG